jgi:sugar lactone lactonase YvrE
VTATLNAEVFDAGPYQLAEGPRWDARTATLVWVDILGRRILRRGSMSDTKQTPVASEVGCIALTESPGKVIAALRTGWHWCDLNTADTGLIAAPERQHPDRRFNDGAVDAGGRLWTGTLQDDEMEPLGVLYRLDGTLDVQAVAHGFICSNGIDWSPDGRWMYFVDSRCDVIFRFAFDAESGTLGDREVFVDTGPLDGIPDGIAVDADGRLWCAFWDGANITCFEPDGTVREVYPVSVLRPTSLTFGGPDLTTMFITSASHGLTADQRARWPLSGAVLTAETDYQGQPANIFASSVTARTGGS